MTDSRVVEALVGLTRVFYKLEIFDEKQQEVEKLFQQLLHLSDLHPLMTQITGLAKERIEAHKNSGALLCTLNRLDQEIHMRTNHLHKVAAVVIAEQQTTTSAPADESATEQPLRAPPPYRQQAKLLTPLLQHTTMIRMA